jgi:penicillin-binding protein 1A
MLKKIFLSLAILLLFGSLLLGAGFAWLVIISPGEEIRRDNIEKILAIESPVFYRDGIRRVGVFFEQAHRQYVPFQRIPPEFVQALVAAEDSAFYQHYGIDFRGVARAALANIKARRVVQGGSTITQQAAKNLFKRKDRSLSSKLKELLYAFRLEYHYDKDDILEFYANQFFVSGTGRGLGMAARYFFDKSVDELDLLESAFIAGSVKGPNHYNPFTKHTDEAEQLARQRARQRTTYVLEQMHRLGYIDEERLLANLEQEIPFQQGQMTFALNTILDLVRDGLSEPEVVEALSLHGIDNVATSGVRIITSVDGDLQDEAHFALRKELSRLDIRLQGYDHRAIQEIYAEMPRGSNWQQQPGAFMIGAVTAIEGSESNPLVRVTLGSEGANPPPAVIDRQGLFNLLTPLVRYRQHAWSDAGAADLARLLGEVRVGDLVYVSVRGQRQNGELLLDLEKYPELQGGALVLRNGAIQAMVGGMENQHYNRAVTARRPMGSAMKPLVYAAALQLGWNSADTLDNRRNVFVYQNQAYFPRPFQEIKHEQVSLSWAGVLSENLASIWLLYHLCDQLPPGRFAELAEHLGLARGTGETVAAYTRRIRDELGVTVDQAALYRRAFERAVAQVEPDLLFAGQAEEYQRLQKFHYGAGFARFQAEIEANFLAAAASAAEKREGELRLAILERNFLRFLDLRGNLRELAIGLMYEHEAWPTGLFLNEEDSIIYTEGEPQPGWQPISGRLFRRLLPADEFGRQLFWDEVLIEGQLRVATLDLLEEAVEAEYRRLAALPAYGPEVLSQIRDFRVLVALHYLVDISRALGVESQLEAVLSFPLGSNAISLLETARIFEAMRDGRVHLNEERADQGGLAIIERIESSEGDLIYAPRRTERQIFAPPISVAVSDILYNAMEHGTGRPAHNVVRLRSEDPAQQRLLAALDLRVPLFGKTGTANRYLNAAFAGYLPGPGENNTLSLAAGYTVATYVGFDDNRPMVRGSTRITGGGGALPLWARLTDSIVRQGDYAAGLDLDDLAFGGASRVAVAYPQLAQVEIPVEDGRGGVVSRTTGRDRRYGPGTARIVTFGRYSPDGSFEPERFFWPYWRTNQAGGSD